MDPALSHVIAYKGLITLFLCIMFVPMHKGCLKLIETIKNKNSRKFNKVKTHSYSVNLKNGYFLQATCATSKYRYEKIISIFLFCPIKLGLNRA